MTRTDSVSREPSEPMDLLVQGGTLVGGPDGTPDTGDIAIRNGVIEAIDGRTTATAAQVVDASGLIVAPGFVDLHTHVYYGATFWGVNPARLAAQSGVTTWIDAGSAGAFNFEGLRRWVIEPSDLTIAAYLNISSVGLVAESHEFWPPAYCDVGLCSEVAEQHKDVVVGIKVRIDRDTVGENGLTPLRKACEVSERTGLPLMVHIADGPPEVDAVLELLRPGDVVTHYATGASMRLLDERGRVRASARRAAEAGVLFDVGHGVASFSWQSAEALTAEGLLPDTISTDVHQLSLADKLGDFPTVLTKYLHLGLDLPTLVTAATSRPADVVGALTGRLEVGAQADLALLRIEEGTFS